ncbi:putative E3 ubiquitin-protein ligase makorin-1 isoform X5 [Anarhichas minor]|uniref:putative E3 ubiquitin-protein ligase makorin-1 isoform X5 n=1 Tax=Anarhichas minor TaxID=65739 RepID=UPI003F738C9C
MAEAAAASMAASSITVGWTKHVTCRYFMHGLCKEGDNCRYSHDLASSKPADMICKFFQKGNCVFGDRCRFDHCKPAKNEELPTPQTLPLPSVSLAGSSDPEPSGSTPGSGAQDWVNATEFVPGQPYCGRAEPERSVPLIEEFDSEASQDNKELRKQLCPYAAVGECRYGINCAYLHGDVCDMCGLQVLHPTDNAQRSAHTKSLAIWAVSRRFLPTLFPGSHPVHDACIEAHEKDMEISFAIQRSKDMMCGVCMEVVFEKANPSERRFGILSNCSHCYCLKCIRKWRSAKQFESKIIKRAGGVAHLHGNHYHPSHFFPASTMEEITTIAGLAQSVGSHPTLSSQASTGWRIRRTSRNSSRNTRMAWGVNCVDTLTRVVERVLLAQIASISTSFLMDGWRKRNPSEDRPDPTAGIGFTRNSLSSN